MTSTTIELPDDLHAQVQELAEKNRAQLLAVTKQESAGAGADPASAVQWRDTLEKLETGKLTQVFKDNKEKNKDGALLMKFCAKTPIGAPNNRVAARAIAQARNQGIWAIPFDNTGMI